MEKGPPAYKIEVLRLTFSTEETILNGKNIIPKNRLKVLLGSTEGLGVLLALVILAVALGSILGAIRSLIAAVICGEDLLPVDL